MSRPRSHIGWPHCPSLGMVVSLAASTDQRSEYLTFNQPIALPGVGLALARTSSS